ncbi:MAG TPA: single-stranded-DNA-specific exonuclease RecJ [Rectinemataceae bacterium]
MKWLKSEIDQDLVRSIAKRYGIDLLKATIMVRRNLTSPGQILYFLEEDLRHLRNPFLFHGMEDAVDRILSAAEEGEKVLVFGDSDTDGVTATTIMVEALGEVGISASWKVPEGEEPYGLSAQAVDSFAAEGGSLIITVDCGISNHEEVARAAGFGIDVIICDHHKLQASEPPAALAVIDPKLDDCGYTFRDLAGAGVAFKLATALRLGRTALYKQPSALLWLGSEPSPEDRGPERVRIEARRLRNLIPSQSFQRVLEPGSSETSEVLESLASFLSGRSVFVYGLEEAKKLFFLLFGRSADLEAYDLCPEAWAAFPELAGLGIGEAGSALGIDRYTDAEPNPLDTMQGIFSALAYQRAGVGQGLSAEHLQLAALGTIADLMPLKDENRLIVRRGTALMGGSPRKGLRELFRALGIGPGLNATEVAWQVTPLINAAGRMGKPGIALGLLMEEDSALREKAALELQAVNAERKRLGSESWEAIYPLAGQSFRDRDSRCVIVGSQAVKPGITGLIASKLAAAFKVPALVAAFKADGSIVGSVRSPGEFKVGGLLAACSRFFIDYGGHDAAAGFSLKAEDWGEFVRAAEAYLDRADYSPTEECVNVDAELPHSYLKPGIQEICKAFEPYGEDNRPIVFLAKGVPIADAQIVGKAAKSHLKLTLDFGAHKWPALLWDGAERLERDFSFTSRDRLDVLFKVTMNRWNGEERPQLELFDLRKAGSE